MYIPLLNHIALVEGPSAVVQIPSLIEYQAPEPVSPVRSGLFADFWHSGWLQREYR